MSNSPVGSTVCYKMINYRVKLVGIWERSNLNDGHPFDFGTESSLNTCADDVWQGEPWNLPEAFILYVLNFNGYCSMADIGHTPFPW